MKKLLIFALLLAVMPVQAQEMDGGGPDFTYVVNYKGARPTITDFIDALLTDEPDETNDCDNWEGTWERCQYGLHEMEGEKWTVDVRNGYVRLEFTYHGETSYHEFCYWNCADGKHKLFAVNSGYVQNGQELMTECTGIAIYRYDNAKRLLTLVGGLYELGIDLGLPFPAETFYHLPRTGKDLEWFTNDGKKGVLKWNGNGFSK